jgi:hypothetical protein
MMKTVSEWFREQQGWRREHCYACVGGHDRRLRLRR